MAMRTKKRESYQTEGEALRNQTRWELLGYTVFLDKSLAKINKFTLVVQEPEECK